MKSHQMLDIWDRKPLSIFMIRGFSDVRQLDGSATACRPKIV